MMTEYMHLAFALLAGAILGVFFFVGLWWTVRKLESAKQVALLFLGSMLLRTSVVLVGFYFIIGDNWQRLLMSLFGFAIARFFVIRFTRIADQSKPVAHKAGHES